MLLLSSFRPFKPREEWRRVNLRLSFGASRHKALSNSDLASFAANFHSMQKSFAHAVVRFHAFVTVFPRQLLMSSHDLLSNSTAYFDVQRPCPQFTSLF